MEIEQHEIATLAARLTKGGRRALMAMTGEFQFPGKKTFNANAAWKLTQYKRFEIVERENLPDGKYKRSAFRLTPDGQRVKAFCEGQDW